MKSILTAPKRQLIDVLQTQLIPWAGSGAPIALLDAPPKILGQNKVTEMPGKALPPLRGFGQHIRVHKWSAENMNAVSMPMFGCVIDGEADLEVGATQAVFQKLKIEEKRWIVAAPKSTFFLIPPGVPVSSTGNWNSPSSCCSNHPLTLSKSAAIAVLSMLPILPMLSSNIMELPLALLGKMLILMCASNEIPAHKRYA